MKLLISSSHDPYWNLATEEYLLKNSTEDYLFIYVNKPCVVVGKHQIAQKEINAPFIVSNKILVARRLSGGGTVYHDEGNLNFSFIQSIALSESVSYKSITEPMFLYLKQLVPEIYLSERNDILLKGNKISGSAMHIYKNRVLAHATLLIDCNLDNLSFSLKANKDRFFDKSIASNRSSVMNLSEASPRISVGYVIEYFYSKGILEAASITLPEETITPILDLVRTKYATEDWIFGYSPKYIYHNQIFNNNTYFSYKLEVIRGTIQQVIIESEDSLTDDILLKLKTLQGQKHNIYALGQKLIANTTHNFNRILYESLF
ncbi:MAG: lipoate--protein ligase [Prolixibacteraceae bacterium]|jgi:lipoate-protein ligase A|nr:lipoate--protein ligase [Prolixibacteraceae bacterium]